MMLLIPSPEIEREGPFVVAGAWRPQRPEVLIAGNPDRLAGAPRDSHLLSFSDLLSVALTDLGMAAAARG